MDFDEHNVIKFTKILDYLLPHIKKFARQHALEFERKLDRYGFFIFALSYGNDTVVSFDYLAQVILSQLFSKLLTRNIDFN